MSAVVSKKTRVDLDYPFEHGGREYKYLELRRCKVGDQDAARAQAGTDQFAAERVLMANLAGVTVEVIAEIDVADYEQLQTVLKSFLSRKSQKSESSGSPNTPAGASESSAT